MPRVPFHPNRLSSFMIPREGGQLTRRGYARRCELAKRADVILMWTFSRDDVAGDGMRQLVEFGLNDGGIILVEVHETAGVNGQLPGTSIPSPPRLHPASIRRGVHDCEYALEPVGLMVV